ncbi:MAG: hypothetical protein SFY66_10330 [Oculatellaceae cyanobacterium bins.114]|nr:hypothetical protein [Oculatellaceae cyanobacterium bins.114]
MTELDKDSAATHAVELMKHYGFDLGGNTAEALVHHWSRDYPMSWLRSGVIEALYQGRYKAISVEQILTLWRRRGHPIHHFNHEFERIICSQFPTYRGILTTLSEPTGRTATSPTVTTSSPDPASHTVDTPPSPDLSNEEPPVSTPDPHNAAIAPRLPVLESAGEPQSNLEEHLSPAIELLSEVRQGELPIQTFKPKTSLELVAARRTGWSRTDAAKHPIHQFIPTEEGSEFYSKLKAVAQTETPSTVTLKPEEQTRQPEERSPEP